MSKVTPSSSLAWACLCSCFAHPLIPNLLVQLLKGKDCVMFVVSSRHLISAEHWVKVSWVDGCRAERWAGRRVKQVGKCRDPFLESQRAPRVKSLGFQDGDAFSRKLSSTNYTNRLIKVLIAQMAPFEKGEARAHLLFSFIISTFCLTWLSDRPCWKCDHSSV